MATREAYVPPSSTSANPITINETVAPYNPVTTYICGECAAKVSLTKGNAIRCNECGHRILYKERTKRMVQFEAR